MVVGSSASLQASAALGTTLFGVYGVAGSGALRFAIAAPILLLVTRPSIAGRTRRFWVTVALLGLTFVGLNMALYGAIESAPLGTVVTIQFIGPLLLALVGVRRGPDMLWVLAAAVGIGLVAGVAIGGSPAGLGLSVVAGALTVASLIWSRRIATESEGLDGLAIAVSIAALLTLPLALHAAAQTQDIGNVCVLLGVGILGLVVPYGLEFAALRSIPAKTFGILLSLDPAIAAITGAVLLAQGIGASQGIGIGLVVLASIGVTRSLYREQ